MRTTAINLIAIVILTAGAFARQNWTLQTNPLGPQDISTPRLGKVQFVSLSEGWITVDNGKLLHTTNGGAVWTIVTPGGTDTVGFSDNPDVGLSFTSPTTGWVIGTLGGIQNGKGAVLYYTTDGGGTWSRHLLSSWNYGYGIQFVDPNNGWAAVASGAFPATFSSSIIHSTDGGNTWSSQYTANSKLLFSSFSDASDGLAVTDSISNAGGLVSPSEILRTSDGGTTWSRELYDTTAGRFESVKCVNASDGWVVGDHAKIIHTTDGGVHWNPVTNTGIGPLSSNKTVFSLGADNCWIGSGGSGSNFVLHTSDGGTNWTSQSSGTTYSVFSIFFFDLNNGWLTAEYGGIAHMHLDSILAGTQNFHYASGWNMISLPVLVTDARTSTLFPSAASNCFAYQGGYVTTDTLRHGYGYWLKMNDTSTVSVLGFPIGNDSMQLNPGWNLVGSVSSPIAVASITSNPGGTLTSVFFGYAGGYFMADSLMPGKAYWVKVNQSCTLRLSSLSNTANRIRIIPIQELPPDAPDGRAESRPFPTVFALDQNFPNPFNPTTTIRFSLPVESYVTLRVYNVLGQEVATLLDHELTDEGIREVEFNAGRCASGVYFYRVSAEALDGQSDLTTAKRYLDIKKMTLLK